MQIEIINLYYFSLQQRENDYLEKVNSILKNIHKYLHEEGISMKTSGKDIGNYDVIEFHLEDIGKLLFFQKEKNISKELTYFPEIYCEIYVKSEYLETTEKLRKLIFLLSNIFECFDSFEEKHMFIEYHSSVEKLKLNHNLYELRHHFHDINELGEKYDFESIGEHLRHFQESGSLSHTIENIKNNFSDTYTSLLLFCYLIFSLQKNKANLEAEIKNLKNTDFSLQAGSANKELFVLRAEEKLKQIETTFKLYTQTFEKFLQVFL